MQVQANDNETSTAVDIADLPGSTATKQPKYTPPPQQPNRAQRRLNTRGERHRLTKKVRHVRGKMLYGMFDITSIMKLGIFTHPGTASLAIKAGLNASKLIALRAEHEKEKAEAVA